MPFLLIFLLLAFSGATHAAEIFLTSAPVISAPDGEGDEATDTELGSGDRAWIARAATVLEPVSIDRVEFLASGAGEAAAAAWTEFTDRPSRALSLEGLPATAARLLRGGENRLLVLDREAMETVYRALEHDISGIRLSDENLIHHLRIHDGRLVSVLFWRVRADAELSDEQ